MQPTAPDDGQTVYKICPRAAWDAACLSGHYTGSEDDARDGFIHLSAAHQVAATAAKYFRGRPDLVLVAIATTRLGHDLAWEPSRGGELFPHLFTPLPVTAALSVTQLTLANDGVPVIPEFLR